MFKLHGARNMYFIFLKFEIIQTLSKYKYYVLYFVISQISSLIIVVLKNIMITKITTTFKICFQNITNFKLLLFKLLLIPLQILFLSYNYFLYIV